MGPTHSASCSTPLTIAFPSWSRGQARSVRS